MKSEKAILPVAGWSAAAAGAAVIVRLAAASEAATASARDAATARLMSVLLALGGLATCRGAPLPGRSPVGEEGVGHAGAHRVQTGAVGVHDVEVLADSACRAFAVVLQNDPPAIGRVAGEAALQR